MFPPNAGVHNASYQNMHSYSVHSYGKTGYELNFMAVNSVAGTAASRKGLSTWPSLPFSITEHAAHTTASWNAVPTTADVDYEASRLAGQMLYTAAGGWETYIFKMSAMQQSTAITPGCNSAVASGTAACGVQKV
jgi:hypothetical protein